MLTLKNIGLYYGGTAVLSGITLCVNTGEICSVLGPSGCGKTSIINILAGNVTFHSGEAALNGFAINHRKSAIGLVSQDYGLIPWLTVFGNIAHTGLVDADELCSDVRRDSGA